MQPKEQAQRVVFERPLAAQMMAIDGTWCRPCVVKEICDRGAVLTVEKSIEGLNEFFLVLSPVGPAYRRCQLERVNGSEIAVNFPQRNSNRKRTTRNPDQLV